MSRWSQTLRYSVLVGIGVVCGVGFSVGRPVQAERELASPTPVIAPDLTAREVFSTHEAQRFAEVLEHVRTEYVDAVADRELIDAAIRGLMNSLDAHSAYLGHAEFDEIRVSSSGEYSGVGIEVALRDGAVKVVTPIEDSPADRAGVLAGDTLLAIDDAPVSVENVDDTVERMRGKSGTVVKITVTRAGVVDPLQFVLARESVHVRTVRSSVLAPGYGYVRIMQFSGTTPHDLKRAITRLRQKNDGALAGVVLDLRNNPGGVLEAGVDIADAFLETGLIVSAEGRAHDAKFSFNAKPGDLLDGAPLVLLVNGGSASASEIVAGALQDHQRAVIVGRQTYGKGSVQTVVPLTDGNAIKLTTSHYFTPSGDSIHKRGVAPDVVIEAAATEAATVFGDLTSDAELQTALDLLIATRDTLQSRLQ